jgi:mono/diheme cytochrome c family protein
MRRILVAAAAVLCGAGGLHAQLSWGPADRPKVDAAAADRGRPIWAAECITCHGTQARGTDNGPNLVRSELVLHDRNGSTLEPFLKKGHQTQSGRPSASLTEAQIVDLANFIRQRIEDTLRGSPIFKVQDVLTGDASAGEAYFKGEGGCTACHTATARSLAGIGGRLSPVDLQQRMMFPIPARGRGPGGSGGGAAQRVTITPETGAPMSGLLVQIDDFYVTYRDGSDTLRTVRLSKDVTVTVNDPLQTHHELLDRITDKQMHDVTAYLVTLK